MDSSIDENKVGPNYFDYFAREVATLLSQRECFFPLVSQTSDSAGGTSVGNSEMDMTQHSYSDKNGNNSEAGPLFCNAFGAEISDFVKERLNALLRKGVVLLSQEVDEVYFRFKLFYVNTSLKNTGIQIIGFDTHVF